MEKGGAFDSLVKDRIKSLDYPRKSWLLDTSRGLKPEGKTIIPFPEFQSDHGRSLTSGHFETLSYTKSDALNMLMAFAGNEETGPRREGALNNEISGDQKLQVKIHTLIGKLDSLSKSRLDNESEYLFQNALTLVKLKVPKDLLRVSNTLNNYPTKNQPLAEGFIVTIDQAKDFLGQIFDQLSAEEAIDQYNGEKITGPYAGLVGCFYDKDDALYLKKMLTEFT